MPFTNSHLPLYGLWFLEKLKKKIYQVKDSDSNYNDMCQES
jgi:hypothetical protein